MKSQGIYIATTSGSTTAIATSTFGVGRYTILVGFTNVIRTLVRVNHKEFESRSLVLD